MLRPGDTLMVWKLDRLSRSLRDLLDIINQLHGLDVGFQSLTERIDTTSAGGKLIFHVIGALAEFERSMIVERTNAGLDAARKRGVKLGPREKISREQWQVIKELIAEGPTDCADRSTVQRASHDHLPPAVSGGLAGLCARATAWDSTSRSSGDPIHRRMIAEAH